MDQPKITNEPNEDVLSLYLYEITSPQGTAIVIAESLREAVNAVAHHQIELIKIISKTEVWLCINKKKAFLTDGDTPTLKSHVLKVFS